MPYSQNNIYLLNHSLFEYILNSEDENCRKILNDIINILIDNNEFTRVQNFILDTFHYINKNKLEAYVDILFKNNIKINNLIKNYDDYILMVLLSNVDLSLYPNYLSNSFQTHLNKVPSLDIFEEVLNSYSENNMDIFFKNLKFLNVKFKNVYQENVYNQKIIYKNDLFEYSEKNINSLLQYCSIDKLKFQVSPLKYIYTEFKENDIYISDTNSFIENYLVKFKTNKFIND